MTLTGPWSYSQDSYYFLDEIGFQALFSVVHGCSAVLAPLGNNRLGTKAYIQWVEGNWADKIRKGEQFATSTQHKTCIVRPQ